MENFKYPCNGNDKCLSYFSKYPLSEWSYENFKNFFSLNKNPPPTQNNLKSAYKYSLKCIQENSKTPENVKQYVGTLFKKVEEKDTLKKKVNQYNFGSDSVYVNTYGNDTIINNNKVISSVDKENKTDADTLLEQPRSLQPQPQHQDQQQQQQQKDEQRKRNIFNEILQDETLASSINEESISTASRSSNSTPIIPMNDYLECDINQSFVINFNLPPVTERYIIDNNDISEKFYNFQMYVKSKISSNQKLLIESDVHHILSLSSILLLKPGRTHDDIKRFIPTEIINDIIKSIYNDLGVGVNEFNTDLMTVILNLIKNIKKSILSRFEGAFKIMELAHDVTDPLVRKLLISIRNMVEVLPMNVLSDDTKEMELITRYLHPALSPLFDDVDNNIFFRWSAVTNLECKSNSSISKRRPDATMNEINGTIFGNTYGFGEVKTKEMERRHHQTQKDLIRLGHFSKNAIEENNLSSNLAFHVVGNYITFYITSSPANYIYTMTQIAHIQLPTSIYNLSDYITHLDEILDVTRIYHHYCISQKSHKYEFEHLEDTIPIKKRQKTITTPEFNRVVDSTKNCHRYSVTSHYGN